MQVAHVSTLFFPHLGGIETMVRALAAGIQQTGDHRCSVLTRRTGEAAAEDVVDGVRVRRVGGARGGRLVERLRFLRAGSRFLRGGAIDLIHAHSLYIPALLAAWGPAPGVATLHTAGPTGNLQDLLQGKVGRFRLGLYKKRLHRIISLTRTMADEVEAAGFDRDRIAVIPNGVDPDYFVPAEDRHKTAARQVLGVPGAEPVVVFFGRLVREKGVDVLIEAWPEVLRGETGAHLVVVGSGEEAGCLREGARAGTVAESIHWVPHVEDRRDVYRAADLLVVPSRAESFGLVTLEGMASGVPVVASRVGGVPEVAGPAAELVSPENPEALAAAILDVLQDSARRTTMRAAGRERVLEHFTLKRVVEQHLDLYHRVMEEGGC